MRKQLSELEKKILAVIQHGMPRSVTPFADMASKVGIETEELLAVIEGWKSSGCLRRFGAVVSHFKVGVPAGAMVAWQVDDERAEQVGQELGAMSQVSHAYLRRTSPHWTYNLYTMVHGLTDEEVDKSIEEMSSLSGVSDFLKLNTVKELKKVPPTYIIDG